MIINRKGQLLVEVLIGIGILAILVSAVVPLILTSSSSLSRDKKSQAADFLARSQMDALTAIKDQDWNAVYFPAGSSNKGLANFYHIEEAGGEFQLLSGTKTVNLNGAEYVEYLTIENVSRTSSNGAGDISGTFTALNEDPSTQKINSVVTYSSGSPVTVSSYVSRWSNSLLSQTDWTGGVNPSWQVPPGNQYSSLTDIDPTVTPGSLALAKTGSGGTGELGNKFIITSVGRIGRLNTPTTRDAMRFTAQKAGQVNQISVYIDSYKNSGSTSYRYGIQSDNSGLPSGTYISSTTAAFAATGWQTLNLSVPVNVTAGTVYHIVIQYNSGSNPGNNRYIDIRNSDPQNNLVPLNQAADPNQNTMFYQGSWTVQNQQPVYILGFSDNTYEGNSFDNSEIRSVYGSNFEAEKFTVSEDTTVSALSLYISKNRAQNPTDQLRVRLHDITKGIDLIDDSSIGGPDLTTSFDWKMITLPSNVTLSAGDEFRLYLSSEGSASNRCYQIYAESNPDNASYNSINWDGTDATTSRSVDGGNNWDDNFSFVDMSGYYFATILSEAYVNTGELMSGSYDFGKLIGLNQLSWSATLPVGTTIKMQLSTNTDNSTWNFVGPDGSSGTYYTISSGENTYFDLSNNRYLRYKVILETIDTDVSPLLDDITINYSL